MIPAMTVTGIPAFSDNYLWLIEAAGRAVLVDPGDAGPVQAMLDARGLRLEAILLTHHHPDHIGGVDALLERGPVPVYGPLAESALIPAIDHPLDDGDRVELAAMGLELEVMSVPGHTLGHIAYYQPPRGQTHGLLFCGDTLFIGGCGKLFEGTPSQMYGSLCRLAELAPDTLVYCAHEYSFTNFCFAAAVEPGNVRVAAELARLRGLREAGLPTVPGTIAAERALNPFLRCTEPGIRLALERHSKEMLTGAEEVFAALRRWKDEFRMPVG